MQKIVLIRGLPGSGKTTLAKTYIPKGYVHLEADQYFTDLKGRYAFDPDKKKEAHKWCRDCTYEALLAGRNVVISNTFLRKCEVEPYRALAKRFNADLIIIPLKTQFKSVHITNKALLEQMKSNWEDEV